MAARFPAQIGKTLNDDRYRITHHHGSDNIHVDGTGHQTYIVKDNRTGKFQNLRIYAASTSVSAEMENSLQMSRYLASLPSDHPGAQCVLKSLDDFWVENDSARYLCTTHELYGPSLNWLKVNGSGEADLWPAGMLWKQMKQMLLGLAFLHYHEVCHGGLDDADLWITYPDLDATDVNQIDRLFGKPHILDGQGSQTYDNFGVGNLNGTGTAPDGEPNSMSFGLGISGFERGFLMKHPPSTAKDHMKTWMCPAPEIVFEDSVGTAADVWALATIMVDSIEGAPYFAHFLTSSSYEYPMDNFLEASRFLGELPQEYLTKLKTSLAGKPMPQLEYKEEALVERLKPIVEEDGEERDYPLKEQSYIRLAAIIRKMMAYKPEQRIAVADVLQDPLFATDELHE